MLLLERQPASRRLVHPTWLLAGFWICVVIAIAVVLRRLIALANPGPPGNSPTASLDATFRVACGTNHRTHCSGGDLRHSGCYRSPVSEAERMDRQVVFSFRHRVLD